MGKKSKTNKKLKDLVNSHKDENPYRQFTRDPKASDLKHENWQKAAKVYLKQDPSNPRRACWRALTLSDHSGSTSRKDANYETMHTSLIACVSNALLKNMIDPDLSSENTQEFKEHIIAQYDHDNEEAQFQSAWDNCMLMTQDQLYEKLSDSDNADEGNLSSARFDRETLLKFERTSIEDFTKSSPISEEEMAEVTPHRFLSEVFPPEAREISSPNSKRSKLGLVAIGEKFNHLSLIFDPLWEYLEYPHNGQSVESLDTFRYFSRSIFKESSKGRDGAGRTKSNLAKEHLLVCEVDFLLPNGLPDNEMIERYNTVMMIAKDYLPLVYVAYSGGKSFHFGFAKNDVDQKEYDQICRQFIYHGADPTVIRDKTKYVRIPNVEADPATDREYQKLLYYDPSQVDILKAKRWDVSGLQQLLDQKKKLDSWHKDGSFFIKNSDNKWIKTSSVEDHLANKGFSTEIMMGDMISPVKKAKLEIEYTKSVDEVIQSLGGYDSGCFDFSGQKVLIRNNRRFPKLAKKEGRWKGIEKFLNELLDPFEYQVFLGWLSDAVRCNYNNGANIAKMTPSQMIHIVAEANAGKTALTKLIIAPLFGGRMVNGSGLFKEGDDVFNLMEMSVEILVIDDKSCLKSTDANREHQGETIKSVLVSGTDEIHGKGANKISAQSFKRIIRVMNSNMIPTLPKINEPSVGDKVIVLRGHARGEAKSTQWFNDMEKTVYREISSFFRYLIKEHETPKQFQTPEDQGRRFPVISHHNAEILNELNEGSKSAQLEDLLSRGNLSSNVERQGVDYFEGTSTEVYNQLRGGLTGDDLDRFKKMFSSPDRLLQTMRELRIISKNHNNQIVFYSAKDDLSPQLNNAGNQYWRIKTGSSPSPSSSKFFDVKKSTKNPFIV